MTSDTPKTGDGTPNLINTLPREILYEILFLCDQTYDIVRSISRPHGEQRFSIGRGCGSRNFGRVCQLWRTCIAAGMVPSTPLSEIQMTDSQFLRIIANEARFSLLGALMTSGSRDPELAILQGYHTITIIHKPPHQSLERISSGTSPHKGPDLQIPAPIQLNLVIVDGRTANISKVLKHFKTLHRSIQDNLHEEYLASHEIINKDNNISINVWNGRLLPVPWSNISPDQPTPTLGISVGFSRADLYINHWTHPGSTDDIPWAFGQLCRNARPSTLGFHLLSPCGSALTDGWHIQKPFTCPNNTLLRNIHVSGLSSDGFLRLLQCSATDIWCVREIKITLPIPDSTHPAEEYFWDWRIFDQETWPVITGEPEEFEVYGGLFVDNDDLQDVVAFPKLAMRRLVDGMIYPVEKERMEARCQIAYFETDPQLGEGMGTRVDYDVECYAGRSLRWASLTLVEVDGELAGDAKLEFDRLRSKQSPLNLVLSSSKD